MMNLDTAYEAVVDKIASTKRKNVEHIDYLEASYKEVDGQLYVALPVVVDAIDKDGMLIENLRATVHAFVASDGTVTKFSVENVSLLTRQLAFDLPESES